MYSALRTTSSLGHFVTQRVDFIDRFLKSGEDVNVLGTGLGQEELKELKEDMIRIAEGYTTLGQHDGNGSGTGSDVDDGEFDYE